MKDASDQKEGSQDTRLDEASSPAVGLHGSISGILNGDGFEKEKVASTEDMVAGDPLCEEPRRTLDVRDHGATRGSSKKSALMDRGRRRRNSQRCYAGILKVVPPLLRF